MRAWLGTSAFARQVKYLRDITFQTLTRCAILRPLNGYLAVRLSLGSPFLMLIKH